MPSFVITDHLPAGLQYHGNPTLNFTGTNVTSTGFTVSGGAGNGDDPVFDLGTVTNNDNDADEEFAVVEFDAVVPDVIGNQSATNLDNYFTVSYNTFTADSNHVDIDLQEPVLNLDKHLMAPIPSPMDAGTVITYEIVLQHNTLSELDAFDVVLTDTFPAELINYTLVSTSAGPGVHFTANFTPATRVLRTNAFTLPLNGVITVSVQAEIPNTVLAGQVITNTAGAVWTTLPGPDANERNGGPHNAPTGEPDGQDFLNGGAIDDYELSDPAVITVDGSNVNKALTGTSAAHTTGTDVTIGEVVTYTLTITNEDGCVDQQQQSILRLFQ
jgi:fimbrial isopeptide formation D2 family protein